VAVFGGTGFLGRRVVRHLLDRDLAVRLASRHPERAQATSALEFIPADITDASIRTTVAGVFGVVNAVSLYVERGTQTFHSVHVEATARLARHSREADVARLVHVSGIGADIASSSPYIRSRGQGEYAVRTAFSTATIIRPAVMFGPDDTFLNRLIRLLRKVPLFPLFGTGRTALQPAYVEDVGEAIARASILSEVKDVYELTVALTSTHTRICCRRSAIVSIYDACWSPCRLQCGRRSL
jgi:NADH dehydrogenase